jgi:hypothetical protein
MITIIAGSRSITDYETVYEAIRESGWMNDITEVVSGCANGVDKLGERFARDHNIPISQFPANWKKYGKQAGYIRNQQMAMNADTLIAIWDMKSKGTANMIEIAQSLNLQTFIWKVYR